MLVLQKIKPKMKDYHSMKTEKKKQNTAERDTEDKHYLGKGANV